MDNYQKIMRRRIKQTVDRMKDTYYTKAGGLRITAYVSKEPLSYEDRMQGEKRELREGDAWGELFDCAWFHFQGVVPEALAGKKIVLLIDVNGEGCIYNKQGEPVLGLTTGASAYEYETSRKRVVPLCESAKGGDTVDVWMDAGNNDLFGRYVGNGTVAEAQIAAADDALRDLYYALALLDNVLDNIDEDSPRACSILYTLDEALNTLRPDAANIDEVRDVLQQELDKQNGDVSLKISAIGHAHIDLAWLWPIRETIRKGARTFATALDLMDRYPEYVFGASQPQLYDWMKRLYPALYRRIREKIKQGRWEVQGAMWVEADTNISGGEALVRQVLYGTRFYRDEFDIDVKNLWLPDVFGYSGALPQILKKSGIPYFMTIKISWNKINRFPYHTFIWRGIDGSDILCHMPPEGNYNAAANASSLMQARDRFMEKGLSDEVLMLYGIGDGGGGPGAHHLERLKRLENFEGLPPVRQDLAANFFERINGRRDRYPSWQGELYLECHQGTYTTQARNKKYNRRLELLLREAEYACVLALKYADIPYPQETLETIWKEVLLYQFHDILPGSSIKRVYDESVERYGILEKQVKDIIDSAYGHLTEKKEGCHTLINSLGWERIGWVKIDDQWIRYSAAPLSSTVIRPGGESAGFVHSGEGCMENEYLKVVFDRDGAISHVYDKAANRETIKSNANVLQVYHDTEDAWDMDMDYAQRPAGRFELVSAEIYTDGPKVACRQSYRYGQSTLVQEISLKSGSKLLIFDTKVDWHEKNRMLRTSFPVSVQAKEAAFNIQFGSIKRPTHTNTSWDMAKYEVCAHKWVDISETGYGVALLNDCKYGHKIQGCVLDLNLLRSTSYPGADADQGEHRFSYALYPHGGDCCDAQVERAGMEFNIKPIIYQNASARIEPLFSCDQPNVVIDTIKKCEDSDDIIVRMYESAGRDTHASLALPNFCNTVILTDMMENELEAMPRDDGHISLAFKPFEIITIKLAD